MSSSRSRQFILVLVAFAVAAGSLLSAGSAQAAQALFRVERKFYGAPFPAVTTPGGAGLYEVYIEPYTYYYNPAVATVQSGNPVGGAFTLPTGFITWASTATFTPETAFPGYTSISILDYYNGPGYFQAGHGATAPTRVVFPTTGGNPTPNLGNGAPVTATTTFSGRYDFSRAGSINVTPGPNRFGGTFQMFYSPDSLFIQYISYFAPTYYKAYGSFLCQNPPGVTCYAGSDSNIGDVTSSGMVTRFLMNGANTAKATTATTENGLSPTENGNASYIVAKNYYLHLIHPWTTGFASVNNPLEIPTVITPQLQGYDTTFNGGSLSTLTVTHTSWNRNFNTTNQTVTTTTPTYKQYLYGVTRIVSMVRPRLKHVYQKPLDLSTDPIISNFQAARMYTMKVFFLPEPASMLLLGVGIAAALGLSRMRRR